jgi:hypothetical protein
MSGVWIFLFIAMFAGAGFLAVGFGKETGRSIISLLGSRITGHVSRFTKNEKRETRYEKPDMDVLNCRVSLTNLMQDKIFVDVFCVEVCGLIRSTTPGQSITVKISISDITDELNSPRAVNAKIKQMQQSNSQEFSFSADLGRVPGSQALLNDWISIAQLRIDQLVFARNGTRKLRFTTDVFTGTSGQEIASTYCDFIYDNPVFGYEDLQENLRQTKTLTVALAFAVCAEGGSYSDSELKLIRQWAREHLDVSETSEDGLDKLDSALDQTVEFFRSGNKLNIREICHRLTQIAPSARKYDVLEVAMQVAAAKKNVTSRQMKLLTELANYLELDSQRARAMADKIILLRNRETRDAADVLGVTCDMNREKTREYLNKEYAKWNARVTSCDPNVQTQADQMLKLIAEARDTYVEKVAASVESTFSTQN